LAKTLKISVLCLVLYIEVFSYLILPIRWGYQKTCTSEKCVKILLVADPQILGQQDSATLARWDCDRYLRRTFSYAYNYAQPDVVVFLGDIMDEGHISSDEQFDADLSRFRSVFPLPAEDLTPVTVFVPGDNDVGGEGDPLLPDIVQRFERIFEPSIEPVTYKNIEFFKINKMTALFQEPEIISNDMVRVGLSHMPVLRRIHTISKKVSSLSYPGTML